MEQKKYKLTVIYGEEACDYWDLNWDDGLDAIKKAIGSGDVEGDYKVYEFETERDRELAKVILEDALGWETNTWDER